MVLNLKELLDIIEQVKNLDGPIVIHTITKKGKGYAFAEEDAFKYHGVTPFEPLDGKFIKKKNSVQAISFSRVFGEKMEELINKLSE